MSRRYGKGTRALVRALVAQGAVIRDDSSRGHVKVYLASGQLVGIIPSRRMPFDEQGKHLRAQFRRAGFDV